MTEDWTEEQIRKSAKMLILDRIENKDWYIKQRVDKESMGLLIDAFLDSWMTKKEENDG